MDHRRISTQLTHADDADTTKRLLKSAWSLTCIPSMDSISCRTEAARSSVRDISAWPSRTIWRRQPSMPAYRKPDDQSLFVVKARRSIFYETPLPYLLHQLGADHLVLCGQVTEQCILYSALDAHIRHMSLTIPEDGVAHIHQDLAQAALRMMERYMGARVRAAAAVALWPGWRPSRTCPCFTRQGTANLPIWCNSDTR
ncbi:cysteine hydrolase family protein [Streptomyces sp. NPDC050421]|uniref:cysteine hydrolase family protein n=1 Tax=unclassified Streptomyces TaxID=2593676 RepID=UPI0037AD7636